MRKEIYNKLCQLLPTVFDGAIKHIDLWNHNVEFIEQEANWERPAVFVEFCPIEWKVIARGIEYQSTPIIKLHVVTDWTGSSSADSPFKEDALNVFDLSKEIHKTLCRMHGESFTRFDLIESDTNHNHDDILENIEVYQCVACRCLK